MQVTTTEIRPGQSVELLKELHILTRDGKMNQDSRRKLKQVNHLFQFIEPLLEELRADHADISLADHGAGKSYLGFILYDLFCKDRAPAARLHGIETRAELVASSRVLASRLGFAGMSFHHLSVAESIVSDRLPARVDLVTALHACDTATDDAIAKGIAANAELIVVAPCCHKQIRREIEAAKATTPLDYLMRHGIFVERQAEMITDGIRALILEHFGYRTKVFEFISDANTPKNVLIVGTRGGGRDPAALEKIAAAKAMFGIRRHYLEDATGI